MLSTPDNKPLYLKSIEMECFLQKPYQYTSA